MHTLNWHKAFKAIRKGCAKDGIVVEVDERRGPGSHRGVVFRREGKARGVVVVIAGGDEISPGVQRRVLADLSMRSETNPLAGEVHRIVDWVFRTGGGRVGKP